MSWLVPVPDLLTRSFRIWGIGLLRFPCFLCAICTLIASSSISTVHAQIEQTFNWYLGDSVHIRVDTLGAEFVETVPFVSLEPSASISNEDGEVLFYTNSLTVWNRNNEVMDGGVLFPTTTYTGSSVTQGALILPMSPPETYYLFTVRHTSTFGELSYRIIDMTLDSGLGGAIPGSSTVLIADTVYERLHAVRHANGRDWWLLAQRGFFGIDKHHIYLVTEHSVDLSSVQDPGVDQGGVGESTSSPDGSLVVFAGWVDNVQLFDFDRCTGVLSNSRIVLAEDSIIRRYYGAAFSPSGEFLYISDERNEAILQIDIRVDPPESTLIFQGDWGSQYLFGQLQLGADNRIYVAQTRGPWPNNNPDPRHRHLGRINYPDSPGVACDYDSLAVYLNCHMGYASLPNFPNYELGALEGSPCDTLSDTMTSLQEQPVEPALRIIPTVGYGFFQVERLEPGWSVEIRSTDGSLLRREITTSDRMNMDLTNDPAGMYLIRIMTTEGMEVTRKIFKL